MAENKRNDAGSSRDITVVSPGAISDGDVNTMQRLCSVLLNEFNYLP